MTDTANPHIRVFGAKDPERAKLEAAAAVMTAFTRLECRVDETWFDMGQGWSWTTVIARDGNSRFQLLSPAKQREILYGGPDGFWSAISGLIQNYA